jgi:membrane associated rhomboid family serine protease
MRQWNATAGPLATKVLIGLNVLVFLLTTAAPSWQVRLSLFGPAVASGEWYRLVTSGFVHYGLLHIAFNMLLLYRFGMLLEPALGRVRFVALYLASLLAGSFGAVLLSPHGLTAGASGAVFGMVGATAIGLRQRGISVWQTGVGGLLVINLVLTFLVPGISVGGHLGGLAGGATAGWLMLQSPPNRRSTIEGVIVAIVIAGVSVAAAVGVASR